MSESLPLPPMLDPLGHDLLRLFREPGCPICAFVAQAVTRHLSAIADESITDPDARAELRQALAFCAAHGEQWLGLQNTLATAIIYHDLCGHLQGILRDWEPAEVAGRSRLRPWAGRRGAQQLAQALTPTQPCPACAHSATMEGHALNACAAGFTQAAFWAAFAAHPIGLCLPHLRALLPVLRDAALVREVVQIQAERFAATRSHLAEVIRKYDYRFVREAKGDEFAAVARSVELVAGRLPTQLNRPEDGR